MKLTPHRFLPLALGTSTLLGALPLLAHADDDPLGAYVAAGVGQSDVQVDSQGFRRSHVGWKVLAGLRPITYAGAEFQYADLGKPTGYTPFGAPAQAHARGEGLFGVGYLPVPPAVDLFAKVGVAHLQTEYNVGSLSACSPNTSGCPIDTTSTRFAFGFGVQSGDYLPVAVRVEYERLGSTQGYQSLASFSVLWKF